jgi:secreted trypsin-like serine protease
MIKTIVPVGLFVLGVAAAGCSAKEPGGTVDATGATATRASRLVGGVTDAADPSVVLFETTGSSGGDCTAEFISTTVLLTAAHCTLDDNGKPLVGAQYRIYMGSDFAQVKDADWIYIDPTNVHTNPAYNGNDNDIAVLVLSKPAAVTPFAWNMQSLAQSSIGQSVRLVGYGANVAGTPAGGADGFGLKRQLTTTVDSFDTGFVKVGKTGTTACGGDSGGPALLTIGGVETIIGLDSYSDEQVDCTGGEFYQRVDTQAAFIGMFMTGQAGDAGVVAPDDGGTSTSGGTSSSGATAGSSSGADAPDAGGSNDTTQPGSGCAVGVGVASSRAGATSPWLAIFALLGLRRRRRPLQPLA